MLIENGMHIKNCLFGRGGLNYVGCDIRIDKGWTQIVSIYCTLNEQNILGELNKFLLKFPNAIIGGDFNARHTEFGDISMNSYGRILYDLSRTHDMFIKNPSTPTCYASTNGSFIDKFILTGPNRLPGCSDIENLPSFSDHMGYPFVCMWILQSSRVH